MLHIQQLIGFGDSSGALAVSYIGSNNDNGAATSFSFAAQGIGAAADDREVVVVVSGGLSVSAGTISCTIGGTAADSDKQFISNGVAIGIFRRLVPTGTTATIACTFPSSSGRCCIQVFRLTGRGTPGSTASHYSAAGDPSLSVNVPPGGIVIAGAAGAGNNDFTWTGATEANDQTVNSNSRHAVATGTGGTITASSTNTDTVSVAVAYWP